MSRRDDIIDLLDSTAPACDDCVARAVGAPQRQQVNQICRSLAGEGIASRTISACAMCGTHKTVNSLTKRISTSFAQSAAALGTQVRRPSHIEVDVEALRTRVLRICQALWRESRSDPEPRMGVGGFIAVLSDESTIPRHQANMMRTICNLRNTVVYDGLILGPDEHTVAHGAWHIVESWWKRRAASGPNSRT